MPSTKLKKTQYLILRSYQFTYIVHSQMFALYHSNTELTVTPCILSHGPYSLVHCLKFVTACEGWNEA